jgi:hypothetical protein
MLLSLAPIILMAMEESNQQTLCHQQPGNQWHRIYSYNCLKAI